MDDRSAIPAIVVSGSIVAFLLLLAGIVVPLAGGTDFNGVPRIVGTVLIVLVWGVSVVSATFNREWVWLVSLVLVSPLAFILYGTSVSNDFTHPEAWSDFRNPPWYLIAFLLTPVVLLAHRVFRAGRDDV